MLASATEVEVELYVPEDGPTFYGVTWAQDPDPRKGKIFIKAFPRTADGRKGLLESTGLVETGDCLTAINGNPLALSTPLHEVMASIRAAASPLTLRFARYPAASPTKSIRLPTPGSSLEGDDKFANHGTVSAEVNGSRDGSGPELGGSDPSAQQLGTAGGGDGAELTRKDSGVSSMTVAEDPELDAVMNSPLLLGLGDRVAGIQKNNAVLLNVADRIAVAAASKRAGVEGVASAAADLTAAAEGAVPAALKALAAAREDATALCETMARLDESLSARERAMADRRQRMNDTNRG